MINVIKNTLLISLAGHIVIFSIFGVYLGRKIVEVRYSDIAFLGDFLYPSDLKQTQLCNIRDTDTLVFKKTYTVFLDSIRKEYPFLFSHYLKPHSNLVYQKDKTVLLQGVYSDLASLNKKESIVMFYPVLPYNFLLYFKDRQVAHIELAFLILSKKKNNIVVKRKVSSGNLEADLLSMRYLSRYLSIQQKNFPQDIWQSVRIDLSAKK
ncbi:MAG: hypothetical protein NC908_02560 [Candidatus Omnitrophica bacterium]|nr:hypothetical protein [Candidatus Omnitrophota bacterium]